MSGGAGGALALVHAGHEEFARRWAEAIVDTSYVSMGHRGLAKHLLGFTQQVGRGGPGP